MAASSKSIISMMQSRHFRQKNSLPVKKTVRKKPNYKLAQKILRDYLFPGDEEPDKKPPS